MKRLATKDWIRSGWLSALLILGNIVLCIAILHWAREVLIPIALAILLTFILAPVVTILRRCGVGRTTSIVVTVVLTLGLLGGIGTMIFGEFKSLADELPAYRQNIRQKIADVRVLSKSGTLKKVQETVNDAVAEFHKEDGSVTNKAAVPVVVTGGNAYSPESSLTNVIRPLLSPLASAGLVIVLVIFMLLRREDLRSRLLRLAGYSRLTATTKAIDEAGQRVSQYLFRQFLINSGFGVGMGLGLYFIGLQFAILWGFLAGVARFIPYFGPLLGSLCPALVSLAVFTGWKGPLLVLGLASVLELITNTLIEPWVYGKGIGVSEVSLLTMMAFWTWLWGPIGLVLATPMTVCLMVISKSVPDLKFIEVLLSNKPALEPHHAFYQRLVAHDSEEAHQIARAYLEKHTKQEFFEKLLQPALVACRRDFEENKLTKEDRSFVFEVTRSIILETTKATLKSGIPASDSKPDRRDPVDCLLLCGSPASDEADELTLMMLSQMLPSREAEMRVLSSELFSAETLAEIDHLKPALVCVGMLSDGEIFPVRQLCKRLRAQFPDLPIIVGYWSGQKREKVQDHLAGFVDAVGWSLTESMNQALQFGQTNPAVRKLQSERLRIKIEGQAAAESLILIEPP